MVLSKRPAESYPQWTELLLPILKNELGSLRLGAVCGERRHGQLVIAAFGGFLLQRRQAREESFKERRGLVFEVIDNIGEKAEESAEREREMFVPYGWNTNKKS